jgi:hypothetical protein
MQRSYGLRKIIACLRIRSSWGRWLAEITSLTKAAGSDNGQNPPKAQSPPPAKAHADDSNYFVPLTEYQDIPDWAQLPNGAEAKLPMGGGRQQARWNNPVPGPETVIDKRTGKPQIKRPGHQAASTAADLPASQHKSLLSEANTVPSLSDVYCQDSDRRSSPTRTVRTMLALI